MNASASLSVSLIKSIRVCMNMDVSMSLSMKPSDGMDVSIITSFDLWMQANIRLWLENDYDECECELEYKPKWWEWYKY